MIDDDIFENPVPPFDDPAIYGRLRENDQGEMVTPKIKFLKSFSKRIIYSSSWIPL